MKTLNQEGVAESDYKHSQAYETKPCCDMVLQNPELRNLSRSNEVFSRVYANPIFSYKLPRPGSTAGKILEHAINQFSKILAENKPMTFKIGITHDAYYRWYNKQFGYQFSPDPFDKMHIVYAAANPYGPAFLEASLIDRFGGFLIAIKIVFTVTSLSWPFATEKWIYKMHYNGSIFAI